jgi:hypothetical protein
VTAAEGPGKVRDGRGVVSGAEDDELGRRRRHLVEQLRGADVLRAGLRVWLGEAPPGMRHRLLFDNRIAQSAGDAADAVNDHPS